jgi:hypothetical protein
MGAPVPPMFAVRDPEGNELTIVEPLVDSWATDPGEQVERVLPE